MQELQRVGVRFLFTVAYTYAPESLCNVQPMDFSSAPKEFARVASVLYMRQCTGRVILAQKLGLQQFGGEAFRL